MYAVHAQVAAAVKVLRDRHRTGTTSTPGPPVTFFPRRPVEDAQATMWAALKRIARAAA